MKRKVLLIGCGVAGFLCFGCIFAAFIYSLTPGYKASATAQAETLAARPTNTEVPSKTPVPSATIRPSATFQSTDTPEPTSTIIPTDTTEPTATIPIDTPAPIATTEVEIVPTSEYPPGATAICKDGTISFSQHQSGTCSRHGGVRKWLAKPPN
jgi:serine/threonine-protein kinase